MLLLYWIQIRFNISAPISWKMWFFGDLWWILFHIRLIFLRSFVKTRHDLLENHVKYWFFTVFNEFGSTVPRLDLAFLYLSDKYAESQLSKFPPPPMKPSEMTSISNSSGKTVKNVQMDHQTAMAEIDKRPWVSDGVSRWHLCN